MFPVKPRSCAIARVECVGRACGYVLFSCSYVRFHTSCIFVITPISKQCLAAWHFLGPLGRLVRNARTYSRASAYRTVTPENDTVYKGLNSKSVGTYAAIHGFSPRLMVWIMYCWYKQKAIHRRARNTYPFGRLIQWLLISSFREKVEWNTPRSTGPIHQHFIRIGVLPNFSQTSNYNNHAIP